MTSTVAERIVEVQQWLPQATGEALSTSTSAAGPMSIIVQFKPLCTPNRSAVVRAIAGGQPLQLTRDARLEATAAARPLPASMERHIAALPEVTYTVEIRWDLLRAHPQVFALDPVINTSTHPGHPHLYLVLHPLRFANAICPYPPHYGAWDPQDSQYPLLVWIAIWLACHQIWDVTGQWIGPQATHNRHVILARYWESECFCGSGLAMRACGCAQRLGQSTRPNRRTRRTI